MFRYFGSMVGPPKTIYDLRKIDGAIRIVCRGCERKIPVRDDDEADRLIKLELA